MHADPQTRLPRTQRLHPWAAAAPGFVCHARGVIAPIAAAPDGMVPGVLLASGSAGTSTIGHTSTIPFTGLISARTGRLRAGVIATDGSGRCSEVVASSFTVTKNVGLTANLSIDGLATFGRQPNTNSIGPVE